MTEGLLNITTTWISSSWYLNSISISGSAICVILFYFFCWRSYFHELATERATMVNLVFMIPPKLVVDNPSLLSKFERNI